MKSGNPGWVGVSPQQKISGRGLSDQQFQGIQSLAINLDLSWREKLVDGKVRKAVLKRLQYFLMAKFHKNVPSFWEQSKPNFLGYC